MGRTFLDLPPEVQSSIISWVLYPHHIASVCLVSRQLHDVSMPFLYHTMYLNVDRWKEEHLRQFISRGHQGHQYVRTLDVDSDELKTEPGALKLAKDVLQMLPRDCLTSFRCPLENGIDNDLMILLASTQSRLDFLSLGPLLRNALNLPTSLYPWPRTTKTIVIPWKINVMTDLRFYQELLQRSAKALQALTVRSETFVDHAGEVGVSLLTQRINPDLHCSEFLPRALFSHIIRDRLEPPLEVYDLNLQNQDLRSAKRTWLDLIDFTKLRTLQLWNCDKADDLLIELLALNERSPLRLHGLVLSFESLRQAPLKALEFIKSIRGLKYLNVCYCPREKVSELVDDDFALSDQILQPHMHSLKDLYLGIGSNERRGGRYERLHVPHLADMVKLCNNYKNLRQLAIAMPVIEAEMAFAGKWYDYDMYLNMLAHLPRLKTLRILTWPIVDDPQYIHPASPRTQRKYKRRIYLKSLDVFATSIARHITHVRKELQKGSRNEIYEDLSVIIFGSAEQADVITRPDGLTDYLQMGPVSYKIRRKQTEFGSVLKAKRIDSQLMECEEPVAYVVDEDTDQGLSLEAYSWGSCNPSWV